MKRLLSLLTLGCLGCTANHAELDRIQAALDLELAQTMARADGFTEAVREASALDARLKPLLESNDALAREWANATASPPAVGAVRAPTTLPPSSVFEGRAGTTKRRRIDDTELRITQLQKILAELDRVKRHNAAARRMLESIEKAP